MHTFFHYKQIRVIELRIQRSDSDYTKGSEFQNQGNRMPQVNNFNDYSPLADSMNLFLGLIE